MAGSSWRTYVLAAAAIGAGAFAAALASQAKEPPSQPGPVRYTADGKLEFPGDYRSWVWLSSGMDMAYVEGPGMANMSMFDNVFVNREAYTAFQKSGTWPDQTIFMLEIRRGEQNGSINKRGRFQTGRLATEAHVKDARLKGGWGFFGFGSGEAAGQLIPQDRDCYSCHAQHAAVDNTFVQFYPTLLPIAQARKTLSAAYLAEEAAKPGAPAAR
jgi:hypothetical protein